MLKKVIITIGFILSFAFAIYAHIPKYINYQGMLSDASGNPLTGNFTVNFRIYDASSGGALLWGPQTLTITADAGIFNAVLGPIEYTVFNGDERWLSLQVGSDAEMTPRKRMLSVSYSFRAHKAQEADKLGGKSASAFVQTGQANSISTNMIQNNAVTASKIFPKIVSSLDGVSNDGGNIDLVGTGGVTITPDDANNKITIKASGGGDNDWTISGNNMYSAVSGNVGIGKSNPARKLDVKGATYSTNGNGNVGVLGGVQKSVYGENNNGTHGWLGSSSYGAYGKKGNNFGYLGSSTTGAYGEGSTYGVYGKRGSNFGFLGDANYGVWGKSNNNTGVFGEGATYGVYGKRGSNIGYLAHSTAGVGAAHSSGTTGYLATVYYGAYGKKGSNYGYLGSINYGVYGKSTNNTGVYGEGGTGVFGKSTANAIGVLGEGGSSGVYGKGSTGVIGKGGSIGVYGSGTNWAVWSQGSSWATGLWLASDLKLKTDVQELSGLLPKLMQLDAKTYRFKTDDAQYKHLNLSDDKQYGFVAQEVERLFPALVTDAVQPAQTDENGNVTHPEMTIKSINYIGFIPLLLQAIQDQQTRIEALEQRVEQLSK